MKISRINVGLLPVILIILSCVAGDGKDERIKETVSDILIHIKDSQYKIALQRFPVGENGVGYKMESYEWNEIFYLLNKYGIPPKEKFVLKYTKGYNPHSSHTDVTVPVYKTENNEDSIKGVEIQFQFTDFIGEKKACYMILEVDRKIPKIEFTPEDSVLLRKFRTGN